MSTAFLRSSFRIHVSVKDFSGLDGMSSLIMQLTRASSRTTCHRLHLHASSASTFAIRTGSSLLCRSTSHLATCRRKESYTSLRINDSDASFSRPQRSRRRRLSTTTSNGTSNTPTLGSVTVDDVDDDDNDLGHKYRRPVTPELWEEFQAENAFTMQHAVDPHLYREIYDEIQDSMRRLWDRVVPPELGPTGKWGYSFDLLADEGNRRVYQRYSTATRGTAHGRDDWEGHRNDISLPSPQRVLTIEPQEEILAMSLTPDETCISSLVQDHGKGHSEVRLRNINTGRERFLPLDRGDGQHGDIGTNYSTVVSLEWGPTLSDGRYQSLYLVHADPLGRPDRVTVVTVESETLLPLFMPPSLVYQNDDPSVMVDVQRTKGCKYVAIQALTKRSNEIYLAGAFSVGKNKGDSPVPGVVSHKPVLMLVKQRQEGVLYHVDVGADHEVVVLMSEGGRDYAVIETSLHLLPLPSNDINDSCSDGASHEDDSSTSLSANTAYCIEDMDLFRNYLVLYERSTKTGEQQVRVRRRALGQRDQEDTATWNRAEDSVIDLSETSVGMPWSKLSSVGNIYFEANFLRFELESPTTVATHFEYHFESGKLTKLDSPSCSQRSMEAESTADEAYASEKIFVRSVDGTSVPMTIVFRVDRECGIKVSISDLKDKTVVLVGYGAYGEPINLGYDPGWAPLLRRGVVMAFAHTRGGGDLGKTWYYAGCRENKERGIEDFESCAKYLKEHMKGVSLAAKGFSAGGVLVGATVNRHPNLFDKVVLTNAFLDVFFTMSDPSLFLTEHEYDEFGDPSSDEVAALIRSYCPIRKLQANRHPLTKFLLICALDDSNVPYWNSTLYFTMLRDQQSVYRGLRGQNGRNCFLHVEKDGGHYLSASARLLALSLENSFLLGHRRIASVIQTRISG